VSSKPSAENETIPWQSAVFVAPVPKLENEFEHADIPDCIHEGLFGIDRCQHTDSIRCAYVSIA
jgi:hypothetical protein